jgi:hypothetical protein
MFLTSPGGVWGPGCWNLDGVEKVPADVGELIKAIAVCGKAKPNGATKEARR